MLCGRFYMPLLLVTVARGSNVPGVKFNNRNWPHIVRTLRLSLCVCRILFQIINIVAGSIVADVWENIGKYVFLAMFLCGVLLPIYVVGKKYE